MRRAWPILLAVVVAGCHEPVKRVQHDTPFPASIALLPMNNFANNVRGPHLIRKLVEMRLIGAGFDSMDLREIDRRLDGIGITDGGQLGAVQPQKLGEVLGVQGLLYGEVLQFGYTNLGVFNKRVVEVHLVLVETATGRKLWEATRKETTSKVGLNADTIKENLVTGLVEKYAETILKNPLRPEAETVVQSLMRDLNRTKRSW
ncbi:MAG: GNA1162 family protein [Candidatus Coatesbacteria bacterium]